MASGALGAAMAGVTLVPESIGLARSLRLKGKIDASKPEESFAYIRERYLQDEVGKAQLERRVGPWLVQEVQEGKTAAAELIALLAEQNRKTDRLADAGHRRPPCFDCGVYGADRGREHDVPAPCLWGFHGAPRGKICDRQGSLWA